MSFREKSLWVSVFASIVIAFLYGNSFWSILFGGQNTDIVDVTGLITRFVIAFVVIEIALHIVLAINDQQAADLPEDERERSYRLKANNIGYWILSIGVVSCIVQQLLSSSMNGQFILAPIELKLVGIFWLSEFTRFVAEIIYYRKDS